MNAKKTFSLLGIIMTATVIVHLLIAFGAAAIGERIWGSDVPEMYTYFSTFFVIDGIVLPLVCVVLSKVPGKLPEKNKISVGNWFIFFMITYGLAIAANLVTTFSNWILKEVTGKGTINQVMDLLDTDTSEAKLIAYFVACFVAPLMEELVFRRMLLTRMLPFGERAAILTSGIMFGLFHGNLSQVLYASILGICFGYLYVRTGKIHYTILLHMLINSIGIGAAIMLSINVVAAGLYSMTIFGLAIAGLVLLFIFKKKYHINENQEDATIKNAWQNIGMFIFIIAILIEIIFNFMSA